MYRIDSSFTENFVNTSKFSALCEKLFAVLLMHMNYIFLSFFIRLCFIIFIIKICSTECMFSSELSNNHSIVTREATMHQCASSVAEILQQFFLRNGIIFLVGEILIIIWRSVQLMNVSYDASWLLITHITFVWIELLLSRLFYKCFVYILKFAALVTYELCAYYSWNWSHIVQKWDSAHRNYSKNFLETSHESFWLNVILFCKILKCWS